LAGEKVIIGSRQREKAERVASEISKQIDEKVRGTGNLEAAREADVIVLSVPYKGMEKILGQIKQALTEGKILISVVAPLKQKGGQIVFEPPKTESAAAEVLRQVPKGVRVVSAFQTTSAKRLQNLEEPLGCDIPVCGDDDDAKKTVVELIGKIPGARGIDCGPLSNSKLVEPIVALLVELTRRHKVPGVGLRFEGL
jgi:NADPH-dependent F420 reductase